MKKNYKLAVVGNVGTVLLFKSLGCESFGVYTTKEAQEKVEKCFRAHLEDESQTPEYAIVFVEEDYYKEFPEDLVAKFAAKALPAIIPIPSSTSGESDFAGNRLRKIVERAIGSDILS